MSKPAKHSYRLNGEAFARSLHLSQKFGVVYVNNPKAACSTIKLTLQRAELQQPDYMPETSVHDHEVSPLLTGLNILGHERQHLDGKFVFSFVRNPFERLKSVYVNKIVRPQKKGSFRVQAGFPADCCPSFEDFVRAVCNQPTAKQNAHWRLQTMNLSVGGLRFDFVGKVESFSRDWQELSTLTGLPAEAHFAGKRSDSSIKDTLEFFPDLISAVRESYAPDFERFGYATHPAKTF